MSISSVHNPPHHGGGAEELGHVPGFDNDPPDTGEKFLRLLRQGAIAGLFYGLWAIGDAYILAGVDFTLADAHAEALSRAALVGVPTLLMRFRRGLVSALGLTALSLINVTSLWMSSTNGDPDTGTLSFLFHLPFTVIFARAAWAARQLRKHHGGRS